VGRRPDDAWLRRKLSQSDFETELRQFAVDTWSAPGRIINAHQSNQRAVSHRFCGRLPLNRDLQRPVTSKIGTMPPHQARMIRRCPTLRGTNDRAK
jgi:hypothetical protein